jgi:hypothetical protein
MGIGFNGLWNPIEVIPREMGLWDHFFQKVVLNIIRHGFHPNLT